MTRDISTALDRAIDQIPWRYPGPGGAVAVLKDAEVLARRVWGFANAEHRIPVTPTTPFRICSISKQFVVALLLDSFADPGALDGRVRAFLPALEGPTPGVLHLCHNQSGLRDYWALAMLQGAVAEGAFGPGDARALYAAARTLQFPSGAGFSYANQNFSILADLIADAAGEDIAALLRRRVFDAAGMEQAFYAADTRALPDGAEGYEGDVATGFRPAINRHQLGGDGAIAASLDDMIAWEREIDRGRDDPGSLAGRLLGEVQFADGRPAHYGFGLSRRAEPGFRWLGHGGALRGWRCQRLYVPEQRVSVVVLFNHMADAFSAALELASVAVGAPAPARRPHVSRPPALDGAYLDAQTGLLARIETRPGDQALLRYGQQPELLDLEADGARNRVTRIALADGGLLMNRDVDNLQTRLTPCVGAPRPDLAGRYHCAEVGSELEVIGAGGVCYGAFAGRLGQGRLEQLVPVSEDVWTLPCARALDHSPPGDWTLVVRRGSDGRPEAVSVGCWLARGLDYRRVTGG
jgi:D-aminopeptidase